jgi:hypothetical protein
MTTKTQPKDRARHRKATWANAPRSHTNTQRNMAPKAPAQGKQAQLIELLRRPEGATVAQAADALGWQAHSVRGVISGVLKKKLGLTVTVDKSGGTVSRYRLA